jgi:hypothetical protein
MGVSVRTLQGWEQRPRQPSGAARILLAIASTNLKAVFAVAGQVMPQRRGPSHASLAKAARLNR